MQVASLIPSKTVTQVRGFAARHCKAQVLNLIDIYSFCGCPKFVAGPFEKVQSFRNQEGPVCLLANKSNRSYVGETTFLAFRQTRPPDAAKGSSEEADQDETSNQRPTTDFDVDHELVTGELPLDTAVVVADSKNLTQLDSKKVSQILRQENERTKSNVSILSKQFQIRPSSGTSASLQEVADRTLSVQGATQVCSNSKISTKKLQTNEKIKQTKHQEENVLKTTLDNGESRVRTAERTRGKISDDVLPSRVSSKVGNEEIVRFQKAPGEEPSDESDVDIDIKDSPQSVKHEDDVDVREDSVYMKLVQDAGLTLSSDEEGIVSKESVWDDIISNAKEEARNAVEDETSSDEGEEELEDDPCYGEHGEYRCYFTEDS